MSEHAKPTHNVRVNASPAIGEAAVHDVEIEGTVRRRGIVAGPSRRGGAPGRPPTQETRIAAIVEAVRNGATTRDGAAQVLGRTAWGELHGDYKRDVAAAGGWQAIKRRAREADL